AIGFEAATARAAVAVDGVAVIARLRPFPARVAAHGEVTGRRLRRIGDRGRRIADVALLQLAGRGAPRTDRGGIALLDTAEHAVAALDQVHARRAGRRAAEVFLDVAVGAAPVATARVAVVAHFAQTIVDPAVSAAGGVGVVTD